MADGGEKDKKPEEKPKMTAGILACLAFSTLAFLLILVLLFEGRTPADAAGQGTSAAVSAEKQPEPTSLPEKKEGLSDWIRKNIRSGFIAKDFHENRFHLGEELKEAIKSVAEGWERILDVKE